MLPWRGAIDMGAAVVLTFREGLEAALILSIVLTFLKKSGAHELLRYVAYAAILAAGVSAAVGLIVFETTGSLVGRTEQLFEGTVMIAAAIVMTHVWRYSRNVRRQYEQKIAIGLHGSSARRSIFATAFLVVLIEGLEIVLFLRASVADGASGVFAGGVIGLVLAVGVGLVFYQTNRLRDAVLLFYFVGAMLILLAAGLLAHGIHEFQEAGVLPMLRENVWNTNGIVNEQVGVGKFLRSLLGYNGNPGLLEVIAWVTYMAVAGWHFQAGHFFRKMVPNLRRSLLR
jgi:high-affinity iron transporter